MGEDLVQPMAICSHLCLLFRRASAPGGHTSTAGLSHPMAAMCMSHSTSARCSPLRSPGVASAPGSCQRDALGPGQPLVPPHPAGAHQQHIALVQFRALRRDALQQFVGLDRIGAVVLQRTAHDGAPPADVDQHGSPDEATCRPVMDAMGFVVDTAEVAGSVFAVCSSVVADVPESVPLRARLRVPAVQHVVVAGAVDRARHLVAERRPTEQGGSGRPMLQLSANTAPRCTSAAAATTRSGVSMFRQPSTSPSGPHRPQWPAGHPWWAGLHTAGIALIAAPYPLAGPMLCAGRGGGSVVAAMALNEIRQPADLRELSYPELDELAGEIRDFIVQAVAENAGHLGSNLGAVELTLALHRVFESPTDAILWDTGHQAYVHKIVTGRQASSSSCARPAACPATRAARRAAHDFVENSHASTILSLRLRDGRRARRSAPTRTATSSPSSATAR